jgi:heat shock protein HslJ
MPFRIFGLTLSVLIVVCFGCGGDDASHSGGQSDDTASQDTGVPTRNQIANLTYSGVYEDEAVALRDGRFEGEPFALGGASRPTLEWTDQLYMLGDLTGDGIKDAAVFLVESSGGSGTRLYIAAVSIQDGQPVNVGTALVGDRPHVRSIDIADGNIWLDIVEQGPDDAACCPTQLARKSWALKDGGLVETAAEVTGSLSLEVLLETEWVLTHFNIGEPAPAEPEITIAFEEKRITGFSGCNRYFAAIEETTPGDVRLGAVAATRMSCPDAIENTEYFYQLRLARVNSYRFLMGNLALGWRADTSWHGTMFFAPRPPTPPVP